MQSTEQYAAGLPRKRMAAGVLFRGADDRVLLVEPSYKPNWELPGGVVEANEAPWVAAARELREELGAERPIGRLLVLDHVHAYDGRLEGMIYVFAPHLTAALEAVHEGATALCEHGVRVG